MYKHMTPSGAKEKKNTLFFIELIFFNTSVFVFEKMFHASYLPPHFLFCTVMIIINVLIIIVVFACS